MAALAHACGALGRTCGAHPCTADLGPHTNTPMPLNASLVPNMMGALTTARSPPLTSRAVTAPAPSGVPGGVPGAHQAPLGKSSPCRGAATVGECWEPPPTQWGKHSVCPGAGEP